MVDPLTMPPPSRDPGSTFLWFLRQDFRISARWVSGEDFRRGCLLGDPSVGSVSGLDVVWASWTSEIRHIMAWSYTDKFALTNWP